MRKSKGLLLALLIMASVITFALAGCGNTDNNSSEVNDAASAGSTENTSVEPIEVKIASLKGPTTIGMVDFINDAKADDFVAENTYNFTIAGTADEIVPSLIKGDIDIALVPANVASTVFAKTEGGVKALNVNTLGVLYAVSADGSLTSLEDLAGRTVYMTGKGTTPEYVMNTLLDKQGLSDKVTLEFKSEATELAAAITADPTAIAVLPEPYVTAVTTQNPDLVRCLSLTEEWKEVMGEELVTGVTVVRSDFLNDYPEVVAEFMNFQKESVDAVVADPATAAGIVVDLGIIEKKPIAEKAIPGCNLVCLEGEEMKAALSRYLETLYDQDPTSVGGALPADDFYYGT